MSSFVETSNKKEARLRSVLMSTAAKSVKVDILSKGV